MPNVFVYEGDCLEVMRGMPDESIDAVVCDPPYGLGKPPPVADVLQAWLSGEPYHAKGGGFMGAKWDAFVPGPEVWRECLRVLKPGGHLLAFFGTRTYHLGATAVELAGFEVRDLVAWLYGQGFPKSRNVSKDIDKVNAEGDRAHRFTAWMRTTGLTAGDINKATNTCMGSHYLTDKSQPAIPTQAIWGVLRPLCGDIPAWVDILIDRVEAEREVVGTETKARSEAGASALPTLGAKTVYKTWDVTTPATHEAAQWEGWGTALKPALEPVVFARKPFKGATYRQVLATGTGAINVDGCRIPTSPEDAKAMERCNTPGSGRYKPASAYGGVFSGSGYAGSRQPHNCSAGRWPANVVLDEEAAAILDSATADVSKYFLVCPDQNQPPESVNIADASILQLGKSADFAANHVAAEGPRAGSRSSDCLGHSTSATPSRSEASCASGTRMMMNSDPRSSQGLQPTKPTQTQNPARNAGKPAPTATTMTTPNRLKSVGCADPATSESTQRNSDPGDLVCRIRYCAKANDRERSAGVGDLKTRHKTVKPLGLMRWLVRLVTPPGGTVLDPFAGSGTTGLAAQAEGFGAVLIEREPEYFALAQTKNAHLALLRGIAALGNT